MPGVAPAPRSKTVDRDGGTDQQLLPGVRVFIDWVVRALGAGHGLRCQSKFRSSTCAKLSAVRGGAGQAMAAALGT
jgi:hypothetical protein